jgi:hypothetical protein
LFSTRQESEGYDTALVCLNGHKINSSSTRLPQFNTKHCEECGEPGITGCPSCQTPIRGSYWGGLSVGYDVPRHCHGCGKRYPWTERAVQSAGDLILLSSKLTPSEKEDFTRAVGDITTDTPASKAAAQKIKIYSAKAGREIAQGVRDIAVNIASETLKKILLGP